MNAWCLNGSKPIHVCQPCRVDDPMHTNMFRLGNEISRSKFKKCSCQIPLICLVQIFVLARQAGVRTDEGSRGRGGGRVSGWPYVDVRTRKKTQGRVHGRTDVDGRASEREEVRPDGRTERAAAREGECVGPC